MIKITHFLFPLTSKKFRDNFKTETVLSSTRCNELLHVILYIKVWAPWQLWNSGETLNIEVQILNFEALLTSQLNDVEFSTYNSEHGIPPL